MTRSPSNTRTLTRLLAFITLLALSELAAQPKDNRLRLIHAEELENITDTEGKAVQYLRGNVKFRKGDTIIASDRAYYRDRDGVGSFVQSVKLEENEQVLTADSLIFESMKDKVTGLGQIHFTDGDYDLKSDSLTYFLEPDSGIAAGNVHFVQKKQTITSHHLTYRKKEGEDAASYTALGEVVIREEDREATCGRSVYLAASEMSILFDDPVVVQGGQTLSGNEIHLQYDSDILGQLIIPDRAHVVYRTKGKVERKTVGEDSTDIAYRTEEFVDDMTGRRLEAYLIDGELDSVRLEGMATSLYHLFEDSLYEGKNIASGDTITLLFAPDTAGEREIEIIRIVGGARGEYYPDEASRDVDAPIFYKADTIHYAVPDQKTTLQKSAQIDYRETRLNAGFIAVTWEDNLLHALPNHDGQAENDSQELPTFSEKGREPMVGRSLIYNLSTGRGRVMHGKTRMEDGYYTGQEIRNRTKDIFLVESGIYTTCDLDPNPHFHFASHQMKMIMQDKIIAKPIVLYLGGIPLAALPFGVFPDQSGKRHSGWIMPSYGESGNVGQYLKDLGYYWAINDYGDSQFTLDFYDKQGIVFHNINRYSKRYAYSGNLNLRYNRTVEEQEIANLFNKPKAVRWSGAWNHRQELRHNQSLNVNARYYSDNQFNRELGIHRDRRLDQKAISNATYSKRWPQHNLSISTNLSETRNLMAKEKIDTSSVYYQEPARPGMRVVETTTVLPSATFRKGQTRLGPSVYWSYSSSLRNTGIGFYESVDSDTTSVWGDRRHESDNSWVHNISLSGSHRLFKHIALTPSLSFQEQWITKYYDATAADTSGIPIDKHEVRRFRARHAASFSLSANTKLYGLFPVRIGSLRSLRHTVTPSIGFSFRPDYSKPLFGYDFRYFKTLRDSEGNEVLFDPFSGTQIGATSKSEQRNLNISLKNVLQAKVKQGDTEKKIDNLVTWNMGTSYNFAAEAFRLSKLRSSIRARLPMKLNLDISLTHDFYRFEQQNGSVKSVNEIATNKWGLPTPRLVRMSAATGFRFSGKRLRWLQPETAVEDTIGADTVDVVSDLTEVSEVRPETINKSPIPGQKLWDLSLNLRYTANRSNPMNPRDDFWMNANLRLQLTKFWRIQYSARFDLLERDIISHDIYIYRDLHCWELSFTWTPGGFGRGFYLRINVKSPTLRDLKLEQRGGQWLGPRF